MQFIIVVFISSCVYVLSWTFVHLSLSTCPPALTFIYIYACIIHIITFMFRSRYSDNVLF
jgi:hypothetical protein